MHRDATRGLEESWSLRQLADTAADTEAFYSVRLSLIETILGHLRDGEDGDVTYHAELHQQECTRLLELLESLPHSGTDKKLARANTLKRRAQTLLDHGLDHTRTVFSDYTPAIKDINDAVTLCPKDSELLVCGKNA